MRANGNEKLYWIDSLRVLAIFSVIVLHVSAPILGKYGSISNFDWWIGNIYDSSVRFCIPIFLMISGALILSKTYESIGEYLKKRVMRILLPFLFWSMIYILKDIFHQVSGGEHKTIIEFLKFAFSRLRDGASYHLWYIYMIIGLYLFFPIIGKWINKSNKYEIKYFIIIWLLSILVQAPFINKIFPNINLIYFSGYIGFPILGFYLYKNTFTNSDRNFLIFFLIMTGILITIFGTFITTKHEGVFDATFYSYLTLNVILASTGIFLLFKNFIKFRTKTTSIILFFSKYSYGTYLIHILILSALSTFGFSYSFINPIIGIPITSILCLIISSLIIWGVNKLPFGKYISG